MSDAMSLGDALKKFLEKSRMKQDIQALQITEIWEEIMGSAIAKLTDRIEIREKTLFIHTQVAPLKNELVFQKPLIIQRINEKMGAQTIRDVIIS
jgi:predicted nucleic acid-binding Zn ribbon protein